MLVDLPMILWMSRSLVGLLNVAPCFSELQTTSSRRCSRRFSSSVSSESKTHQLLICWLFSGLMNLVSKMSESGSSSTDVSFVQRSSVYCQKKETRKYPRFRSCSHRMFSSLNQISCWLIDSLCDESRGSTSFLSHPGSIICWRPQVRTHSSAGA